MNKVKSCNNEAGSSSIALYIAVVTCERFQFVTYELPEAAPERYPAHGVKQKVDAEVCVVEKHEELLHAPQ